MTSRNDRMAAPMKAITWLRVSAEMQAAMASSAPAISQEPK